MTMKTVLEIIKMASAFLGFSVLGNALWKRTYVSGTCWVLVPMIVMKSAESKP